MLQNPSEVLSKSVNPTSLVKAQDITTSPNKWTTPEVLQLLQLYKVSEEKFKDPKKKKKAIWEEISRQMHDHNYPYSASKCEVKFKNLKQKYVKTVDHNNKSGNDSKTCSYFEELDAIFAYNPSVCPIAECSNRKGYMKVVNRELLLEANEDQEDGLSDLKLKRKRSSVPHTLEKSLSSFHKDLREDNEQRMKKFEEMHQEKMRRFDRLLDLYEKDISSQLNNN